MGEEMLTVREAAVRYGRNPETIRRWIWAGKLPAKKLGNQLFVSQTDLLSLKEKERTSSKPRKSPDFLARAQALQTKIRHRTKTSFDASLLIEQARARDFPDEDLY